MFTNCYRIRPCPNVQRLYDAPAFGCQTSSGKKLVVRILTMDGDGSVEKDWMNESQPGGSASVCPACWHFAKLSIATLTRPKSGQDSCLMLLSRVLFAASHRWPAVAVCLAILLPFFSSSLLLSCPAFYLLPLLHRRLCRNSRPPRAPSIAHSPHEWQSTT